MSNEVTSPMLHGGVIPQQWEHLIEENRKLKQRIMELEQGKYDRLARMGEAYGEGNEEWLKGEVERLQKAESLLHCICAEALVSFASYEEYEKLYPEFAIVYLIGLICSTYS